MERQFPRPETLVNLVANPPEEYFEVRERRWSAGTILCAEAFIYVGHDGFLAPLVVTIHSTVGGPNYTNKCSYTHCPHKPMDCRVRVLDVYKSVDPVDRRTLMEIMERAWVKTEMEWNTPR